MTGPLFSTITFSGDYRKNSDKLSLDRQDKLWTNS